MEVLANSHRGRFLGVLCKQVWEGGDGITLGSGLVPGPLGRGTHESTLWADLDILKL